jgi:hypothetical protein
MKRASALRLLAGGLALAPTIGCAPEDTVFVPHVNPVPEMPTTFGAQIYASDDIPRSLGLIADVGGGLVRTFTDFTDADLVRLDALMPAARALDLRVVVLTSTTLQPVDLASYAAYCVMLQKRYAAYAPIWEIWNEPNLAAYWRATPNVGDYSRLALAVGQALRSAGATDIWTGGTSGLDAGWVHGLVENGVFSTLTGCGVHSYEPVGGALTHYLQVRALLPSGIDLRTTETGVPTGANQKDFLTGMWFIHRRLSLPTMIWVEFRDGTAGASGPDSFPYGLVTADYTPKLNYYAAKELIRSFN